jgi:hypothetical protein
VRRHPSPMRSRITVVQEDGPREKTRAVQVPGIRSSASTRAPSKARLIQLAWGDSGWQRIAWRGMRRYYGLHHWCDCSKEHRYPSRIAKDQTVGRSGYSGFEA